MGSTFAAWVSGNQTGHSRVPTLKRGRRIAERARLAESALTIYLRVGEQILAARALIESCEMQQHQALSALANVLGRDQAAAAAGVEVRDLRAALAQAGEYKTGSDRAPEMKVGVDTP